MMSTGLPIVAPSHDVTAAKTSRGLSVWHYLVALTLLPGLVLPVLGVDLARQHVRDAATAVRIEHDIAVIQGLDDVRNALDYEVTAGSLTMIAEASHVTLADISRGIGAPTKTLSVTRASTDGHVAALAFLARDGDQVPDVRSRLSAVRGQLAAAMASDSVNALATVNLTYAALGDQLSTAERSMAHRLVSGGEGTLGPSMVADARALEAIAAAVIVANQAEHLYLSLLYPGQSGQQPTILRRLATASQEYRVRVADLGVELTASLRVGWQQLGLATEFPAPPVSSTSSTGSTNVPADLFASLKAVSQPALKVYAVNGSLAALLHDAVTQSVGQARADAHRARHDAWVSVAVTLAAILGTVAALALIGGLLRRRLGELAAGAQRLSAGYLQNVPVHGPRELASTSRAINDAVASLRQVEAKAELLASGDLTSPELERAAPGPLGAAVHQSVTRIVTAVREREVLQQQLTFQAAHDDLTGLTNRAELERTLLAVIAGAQRTRTLLAVLFVDLDQFKACNDRLGHAAGDHVLRVVAERLRAAVGEGDIVARLGGDEFVVVIPAAGSEADAISVGRRIVEAIGEPIWYHSAQVQIGASAGLSLVQDGALSPDQMLLQADIAAYTAKSAGGGRLVVHDPDLSSATH